MKYILGLVIVLALVIVGVTVGANNDQIISVNYVFAKKEIQLSTLVAILFGFGFILGWLVTAFFYLKLKLKNMALNRQIKRQTQQINQLMVSNKEKAIN